jgi:hypothetical protein
MPANGGKPEPLEARAPLEELSDVAERVVATKIERIPATREHHLATELHELRVKLVKARDAILSLQSTNLELQRQILKLDTAAMNDQNAALRRDFDLAPDKHIRQDTKTGEWFFERQ